MPKIGINPSIGPDAVVSLTGGLHDHFIHVDQPQAHAGVERVEAAIVHFSEAGKQIKGERGLAALLLGGVVSAVVLVADRIVVQLAQGGLLLGWIVLWGLTFVAIASLADTARSLSLHVAAALGAWHRTRRVDAVAPLSAGSQHDD